MYKISNILLKSNIIIFIAFFQQQEQDPTNLYISNLPLSMDEQELENMLKPFGQVISTRILRDSNGTSRGVGFARYDGSCLLYHFMNSIFRTIIVKVKWRCLAMENSILP